MAGKRFSQGGRKSRGRGLSLDFNGFADLAERLDELGANIEKEFTDAMEQAAETVEDDTRDAVASSNLPAGGKYSRGETEAAIIPMPKVQKEGPSLTVNLGFDFAKPGAGGFLITGTPKMRPDYKLEDIYSRKKYANKLMEDIREALSGMISYYMGG